MTHFSDDDYLGSSFSDSVASNYPTSSFSNQADVDSEGILENLRNVFDFSRKSDLFESLVTTSGGRAFSLGTLIFLMLMVISIYLDSSLRSQMFYVFDNCTNEDCSYEYIVKIRFGLSPDFTSRTDLIIEFYSDKFKLLSKFIVSGSYLENGLNIGTKMCAGMKITSLYLFKNNSLSHIEYCRAYLNTNDPQIAIHLYSIEVGTRKEVNVFFMNHAINRSNPNATQLSLVVEEPITPTYKGVIMETSYLQASIFIYLFFLFGFFFYRLAPFEESFEFIKGFPVNRSLLVNSTLIAMFTGALYLAFREFFHARYAANNGAFLWCLLETLYECSCVALGLFLASASIMTDFKHDKTRSTYLRLVLYSAVTLTYWTPIAFFYFYMFSPGNYHIGRIIMKNVAPYQQAERSRIRRGEKSRRSRTRADEEEAESYVEDKGYAEERSKSSKQSAGGSQPQQVPAASQPAQATTPKSAHQQASYRSATAREQSPTATSRQLGAFGLPSPVTYQTDKQQQLQTQAVAPVFQTKDQADKSLATYTYELVAQYQTLRDKIQKSQIQIPPRQQTHEVSREDKERMLKPKVFKKIASAEKPSSQERKALPQVQPLSQPPSTRTPKKSSSKTSIASTGSDYYAAMFKDGKVKVGSISQYGSLLKQREENLPK